MKKFVVLLPLALAACAGGQNVQVSSNLVACGEALLAGASSDPVRLLAVAASSPACQGLASDVIQQLVQQVSVKQRSRGIYR